MLDRKSIRRKLSKLLDEERLKHSENVEKIAVDLAKVWGEPKEKAGIAGLLHDCSRWMKPKQMLDEAKKQGVVFGEIEVKEPKLLHAKLSAHIARDDFGIDDIKILTAIERHTTGAPGMSTLDKIIYLADHIEPARDFKGIDDLRVLAYKDLDRAIVQSTSSMIEALMARGLPIYGGTIDTRNYYLNRDEKKKKNN
jgi:predicted HD superfamily hydrolase involved in NAD metabolism